MRQEEQEAVTTAWTPPTSSESDPVRRPSRAKRDTWFMTLGVIGLLVGIVVVFIAVLTRFLVEQDRANYRDWRDDCILNQGRVILLDHHAACKIGGTVVGRAYAP